MSYKKYLKPTGLPPLNIKYKIAAEAGLFSDEKVFTKFPNSDLATVSVNLLKGK